MNKTQDLRNWAIVDQMKPRHAPAQSEPVEDAGECMQKNALGDKCPQCGADEIEANTPATVYACGSRDYDQRPGTFKQGKDCKPAPSPTGDSDLRAEYFKAIAQLEHLQIHIRAIDTTWKGSIGEAVTQSIIDAGQRGGGKLCLKTPENHG